MRKLLSQLQKRLNDFIEQRDDFTLIVRCNEFDSAHVLKTIEAIDEGESPDYFWIHAQPFTNIDTYVGSVVKQFADLHTGISMLMEEEGQPPWPSLPAELFDETRPSLLRLKETMIFSRSLLPSLDGHLSVWVLFPSEIENPHAYAALINAVAEYEMPFPWCHHLRLMVRDAKENPVLKHLPEEQPGVQYFEPDLGIDAIEQSFEDEVNDENEPLPLRMQALLVLAGMDYSNRRYDDAFAKYELLLPYFQVTENPSMVALTLNGIGETLLGMERDVEAKQHWESALTPAIDAEANPILLNITINLANLHLKHEVWDEAESYYDGAEKIATALLNVQTKIQCLENKGVCQYKQGHYKEAVESWVAGATLARSQEENELLKPILHRLHELYEQAGMSQEQYEVARELSELG